MTNNQQDIEIPILKKDAIIRLEIGTAWIQKFQEGFMYLLKDNEEDIKKLEARQGNQDNLTGWEQMVIASSMLLQEIMTIAHKSDQIEQKSLNSIIPNSLPQDSSQHEQ